MVNPLYILLPCAVVLVTSYHGDDLPKGPFCGLRNECCTDRNDRCAHEILDTVCYCDEHCNRAHDDCCPDYEEVCLGIFPTTPRPTPAPLPQIRGCTPGTKRMQGCNECTCDFTNDRYDWVCEREDCMMSDEVIQMVNHGETWIATNYSDFATKKLRDGLVYKLGTMPLRPDTLRMYPYRYDKDIPYPPSFDSRSHWPGFVSPVIDQGWCGSDWAVTIAAVASDRLAIQSNGAETVKLSPQTMLSCNKAGQLGCKGGHIDVAWNFVTRHGLVEETCFPYEAKQTKCPYKRRGNLISDGCRPQLPKRTSRYKVGPSGRLSAEKDIMYDIMTSGPVHALMTVYQDFFHYREGIYRHTHFGNELYLGLHSVRIIGWGEERRRERYWGEGGEEPPLKYWLVANSWGKEWGEDGYFRIKRGVNETGIESFVITVAPEVTEA